MQEGIVQTFPSGSHIVLRSDCVIVIETRLLSANWYAFSEIALLLTLLAKIKAILPVHIQRQNSLIPSLFSFSHDQLVLFHLKGLYKGILILFALVHQHIGLSGMFLHDHFLPGFSVVPDIDPSVLAVAVCL